MKKSSKMGKRIMSLMALILCVMMVLSVLPAGTVSVFAADDVYANQLVKYEYNDQCYGRYFTPIAPGKYPTFIMICGKGGDRTLRQNLRYYINEWVKAGYFPPMNVVIPAVEDFDGSGERTFGDFFYFTKKDHALGLLLEKIESGQLSSQIDTSQDILLAGFSQGGMCALQCGAEFNTRLKKIGALSPAAKFWVYDGDTTAYYPFKKDIYYSKDPDAFVFMSAGVAEQNGEFTIYMNGFEYAIASNGNNKSGIVERFDAPSSWGGHAWAIEKKEIFMYLWRAFKGEYPTQADVEAICNGSTAPTSPADITQEAEYQIHPAPSFTVSPYEGSKLVDIDMSTFAKDTTTDPIAAAGSIGNVTNTGTLASSTTVKMSSKSGTPFGLDMTKKSFTNNKGTKTYYLEREVNDATTGVSNNYMLLDEPSLETRANTISFWAKYTPINKENTEYSFFDYNTTYSGESDPQHLLTFDQKATTSSQFVLNGRNGKTGRWDDTQYGDITSIAADKWTQFTITNPGYESNGKKTMKVYVNGEYLYSKIVTKPSGTATSVKLTFGGENSPGEDLYWPDNYTLGNVTVYDGALTSEEVYSEYNLNKDYYIEGTSSLPDITGYTFSDSTVDYDGASHNLAVAAGSGATQGVNIEYTSGGAAFTGAADIGTYYVTAKISKQGYNDLILDATLKINGQDITGYTFSDSTFMFNGSNQMINVQAGSGATQGVNIAYTCNGAVFTGATLPGIYPITATITKAGYNALELSAVMTINISNTPFVHDKYLDLDMTNLAAEAYTPTASSVAASSGITKSGDWAEGTTLGFSKRPDGENSITKGSIANAAGGTTYYLDFYDSKIYPHMSATDSYLQHLTNLQMHNTSFESADNTISFWLDAANSHVWKQLFCYRVDYTSGGSKGVESFDLGINPDGTWNAVSAPASSNPGSRETDAFAVPDGWKHVLITNPKRSGGKKTMNVYINGALKKTVTLDIPDGATIDRATISFFSKSIGSYTPDDGPWRTREAIAAEGKIGDFKIYQGVLSGTDIPYEYYGGVSRYTEGKDMPPLEEITGYTFSGSTVTYDGQNHMINVAAGAGATEGVTIKYTSNGAAFTGATDIGSYPVTATISKDGYYDLVLSATLTIKSDNPPAFDVLLSLDMSNLLAESFAPTLSSIAATSGITKSGDWADGTTLGFSERPDGENTITKGSFENADGGTTNYLDYSDSKINPHLSQIDSYVYHLINMQMYNNSFESADNTISFWFDAVASHVWKELFCYRVDYTSGGSKGYESFDLGINSDGTWNALSAPTSAAPSNAAAGAFTVSDGWKHVVITNPARSGNQKTMNVYVDGALKKTVTLDIPDGATIDRATISFFSKATGAFGAGAGTDGKDDGPWRTREALAAEGKIGDFKIYDGVLSASDVSSEYVESINRYSEGTALETITGYTFSNSTVTYDGENHMINVAAGSGATQDVTTTYTCDGSVFSGAAQPGTYNITATISKAGYQDLVLSATLTIEAISQFDFDVTYDKDTNSFTVTGEVKKADGTSSVNSIDLLVNEPGTDGDEGVIYADALNNHSGPFEFTVPLSDTAPSGIYTFTVASNGEVVVSAVKTCEMTGKFGIYGTVSADSEISATYTTDPGEVAPVVIIAVYKDGGIVSVSVADTPVNDKVTATVTFDDGEDTTGYTAKAFVWKDITTLQPLCRAYLFK